ncbi:MAG: hypothetical protein HY706_05815, partial [Candidatus Hydrogenedentes bacterium]|nr:hypothetical protein [Candidatus Hydrogenedentota bacterium]
LAKHDVSTHKTRPFFIIQLSVTNAGDKAIEVSQISSVVLAPGALAHWGPKSAVSFRRLTRHGPYLVFDPKGTPVLATFADVDQGISMALGTLPVGTGASGAKFAETNGQWSGEVSTVFTPPVHVAPGETLAADPVWLAFALPKPPDIDMYYSWAQSTLPRPDCGKDLPDCWITVDDASPESALYSDARSWTGPGTDHVLIPAGWAKVPGTLDAPVSRAARELAAMGKKPGLSLDPLAIDIEFDAGQMAGAGRKWTNLAMPEARARAVEKLKSAARVGFAFFVVQPSQVPDEVLREFNMTRTQAEQYAFEVVAAAAGGLPVLPASCGALAPDLNAWLEAAGSSGRLAEYAAVVGPARLNVAGVKSLSDELIAALAFYGGPIELVGTPGGNAREQLEQLFPRPTLMPRPLDNNQAAPKLWQVPFEGNDVAAGCTVVSFPGGPTWGLSNLALDTAGSHRLWQAKEGKAIEVASSTIAPSEKLSTYGLSAATPDKKLIAMATDLGLPFEGRPKRYLPKASPAPAPEAAAAASEPAPAAEIQPAPSKSSERKERSGNKITNFIRRPFKGGKTSSAAEPPEKAGALNDAADEYAPND